MGCITVSSDMGMSEAELRKCRLSSMMVREFEARWRALGDTDEDEDATFDRWNAAIRTVIMDMMMDGETMEDAIAGTFLDGELLDMTFESVRIKG